MDKFSLFSYRISIGQDTEKMLKIYIFQKGLLHLSNLQSLEGIPMLSLD